ncbi:MAG TPA: ABC transporter permease [Alphaproteobacteria bacterium]|nr:ABC transporter permease [Alphaproteobacteria bacterium]
MPSAPLNPAVPTAAFDWKAALRRPEALSLLAIAALLALGEALSPGFAGPAQIVNILGVAAFLGLVAAGQTLVILAGKEGIDLSIGSMVSLGALVAGNAMQGGDAGLLPGLILALAVGGLNGCGITLLRIPPLVMTLGMAGVLQGLLVLLTRGKPSGSAAPLLAELVAGGWAFGLPGILVLWLLFALGLAWLLRGTRLGLRIYAIGSNERAAGLVGVPVRWTRIAVYGLSGLIGGLTGFLMLGYTGSVYVGVGDQYVLPSIIAVVIGGTALGGGAGGYLGTALGAIVLVLLQSILTTLSIEPFGRQMIFGLILLGLLAVYGRQKRLRA